MKARFSGATIQRFNEFRAHIRSVLIQVFLNPLSLAQEKRRVLI